MAMFQASFLYVNAGVGSAPARRSEQPARGAAEQAALSTDLTTEATVKVWVGDERRIAVGEGNGPVNALDQALRRAEGEENLRRQVGIVLRSGALRDLHDVALAVGAGANAILPYALYAAGLGIAPRAPRTPLTEEQTLERLSNTVGALTVGLQKVTSTIGCHELRGYGKSFSSIGLASDVAAVFNTPNYFGSSHRGTTWSDIKSDSEVRAAEMRERMQRINGLCRTFEPVMYDLTDTYG